VDEGTVSSLDEIDSSDEMDECVWCPNESKLKEDSVVNYSKSAFQSHRAFQYEQLKRSDSNNASIDVAASTTQSSGLKRKIDDNDGASSQKQICVRDDEDALKILLESQYDVEAALASWKLSLPERRRREQSWTEEEQSAFEEGLKVHGKNFRLIQQEVRRFYLFYKLWFFTEIDIFFSSSPIVRLANWYDIIICGSVPKDTMCSFSNFVSRNANSFCIRMPRKRFLLNLLCITNKKVRFSNRE
jgi:hypothetical protein